MEVDTVVRRLGLAPHPEGGFYRETWRAPAPPGARAAGSAILFLLAQGQRSRWHRIDAAEIWHFHAGAPLELSVAEPGGALVRRRLGLDLAAGETPQLVVPPNAWQQARSLGAFTLVGCTVSPAFLFERFELAPEGLEPGACGGTDPGAPAPE